MKRSTLFAVLLLGFSIIAVAQDVPVAEVFGGYSYFRCDKGIDYGGCNLNGWNASAGFNVNSSFGIVADSSGYYGDFSNGNVKWKIHSFMFGPKYTLRLDHKAAPFAQALFGFARTKQDSSGSILTRDGFAMAFGGGFDIGVSDRIAIRPAQLEFVLIRKSNDFSSEWRHNFRFSTGVVFKLGKR